MFLRIWTQSVPARADKPLKPTPTEANGSPANDAHTAATDATNEMTSVEANGNPREVQRPIGPNLSANQRSSLVRRLELMLPGKSEEEIHQHIEW